MKAKRREYCLKYLQARREFRNFADNDEVLRGNDNIIGRIGEAVAHSYLEQFGRNPVVEESQTKKGFDILCNNDITQRISVKTITAENKTGGTTIINDEFDELILVSINQDFKVDKIGHIRKDKFLKAYKLSKKYSAEKPYFRKSMLDGGGLIDKSGILVKGKKLEKLNLL